MPEVGWGVFTAVVEGDAARRERVQMRRTDNLVAIAAGDERVVLVGDDVEQVRALLLPLCSRRGLYPHLQGRAVG